MELHAHRFVFWSLTKNVCFLIGKIIPQTIHKNITAGLLPFHCLTVLFTNWILDFTSIQSRIKSFAFGITSCTCERSFSMLCHLCNSLRSSMDCIHLSSLALMNIHYGHAVNYNEAVDIFLKMQPPPQKNRAIKSSFTVAVSCIIYIMLVITKVCGSPCTVHTHWWWHCKKMSDTKY